MVDTGSNVTIVNPAVIAKIGEAAKPVIETVENELIMTDGSTIAFLGMGTFDLEVEGMRVKHEVWIAEIELEGNLGLDFMCKYQCNLILGPEVAFKLSISNLSTKQNVEIQTPDV